jgi:transposase
MMWQAGVFLVRQGCQIVNRYELTEKEYRQIRPLLPGQKGCPGGQAKDNRLFVNAVIWIARTGAPWRDLPERFGNWNSVFQRFNRWSKSGVWQRIARALQSPGLDALLLDSTVIRAHQHAAGSQKKRPPTKPWDDREADLVPSSTLP